MEPFIIALIASLMRHNCANMKERGLLDAELSIAQQLHILHIN